MDQLAQDLRSGLRQLRKHPGSSVAVVLMLALGVGSVTASFSLVDSFFLRPLPYEEPERLVHLFRADGNAEELRFSLPAVLDLRSQPAFEGVAAYNYGGFNLTSPEAEPERLTVARLTTDLLPMLGAEPVLGRGFSAAEGRPGGERVVLLSHGLWQRRFGGERAVLGGDVRLDGESYTVAGVMPEGFRFPFGGVDAWIPLVENTGVWDAEVRNLLPVARLAPGTAREEAATVATAVVRRRVEAGLDVADGAERWTARAVPLRRALLFLHDVIRLVLGLALAGNVFVLLVVAANVANLMLVRSLGRRREAAVRASLGADRGRLVRQLLTEGMVLAAGGAALGVGFAHLVLRRVEPIFPRDLYRVGELAVDAEAVSVALVVTVVAALAFSLVPALEAGRANLGDVLRVSAAGSASRGNRRLRNLLVVTQVGLSVLLLVGTLLTAESVLAMRERGAGFDPSGALTLELELPPAGYPEPADVASFHRRLLQEVEALPGVEAAAMVNPLPLNFEAYGARIAPAGAADERHGVRYHRVSPGFFRALGLPLVAGRGFAERDGEAAGASEPVAVVNAALAGRLWPEGNPAAAAGRSILLDPEDGAAALGTEVVGVVADSANFLLNEEAVPILYLPQATAPQRRGFLVARAESGRASILAGPVRDVIARLDPELPVGDVRPMSEVMEAALAPWTGAAVSTGVLALFALVLSALGIWAVVSYSVGRRTWEIGVRMALGAQRGRTVALVARQGLVLVGAGLAVGLALAAGLTHLLAGLLYGVRPLEPRTLALATAVFLAVAAAATLLPARRAARVDPATALRAE